MCVWGETVVAWWLCNVSLATGLPFWRENRWWESIQGKWVTFDPWPRRKSGGREWSFQIINVVKAYPCKARSSNWAKLLLWWLGYVLENTAPALPNTIAPQLLCCCLLVVVFFVLFLFLKGKKIVWFKHAEVTQWLDMTVWLWGLPFSSGKYRTQLSCPFLVKMRSFVKLCVHFCSAHTAELVKRFSSSPNLASTDIPIFKKHEPIDHVRLGITSCDLGLMTPGGCIVWM